MRLPVEHKMNKRQILRDAPASLTSQQLGHHCLVALPSPTNVRRDMTYQGPRRVWD